MRLLLICLSFLFAGVSYGHGQRGTEIRTTIVELPTKVVKKTLKTPKIIYKTKVIYKTKIIYRTKIVRVYVYKKRKVKKKKKKIVIPSTRTFKGYMFGAIIGYGPRGLKKSGEDGNTTVDQKKGALFGGRISKCIGRRMNLGISALNNSSIMLDVSLGLWK